MNRQEYLIRLKAGLNSLPKEEAENVVAYYAEYFEDAGEENEQAVIEELGEPSEVAARVLAEMAIKYIDKPVKTVKEGFKAVKMTVLAVCAAPIALPLAFSAVVLILCMALVVALLYLCVWIMAAATVVSGVIGCVAGVSIIFSSIPSGIAVLGASLISIGLGILCAYWGVRLGTWLSRILLGSYRKLLKRRAVR